MKPQNSSQVWFPYKKSKPQVCLRIFCFPYAGGGVTIYRSWNERFPATVEVVPVQLPGRENRVSETPYTNIHELVAALGVVIQPYLDLPCAFFGHSMGALISFELARYLRRQYRVEPRHLFLSACRAPHLPNPWPILHDLPREQLMQNLLRLGGTSRELLENSEAQAVVLPLMRADFALCETYTCQPESPLSASLTVFGGKDDKTVSLQEFCAWQEHTSGLFMQQTLPGNHFFIHTEKEQLLAVTAQTAQWLLQQSYLR